MSSSSGTFTDFVGVKVMESEGGNCRALLPYRPELNNINGSIHGGVTAMLLDVAMGGSIRSMLQPDERSATIEMKINFLAAAKGDLTCTARMIHRSKWLAVSEGEAYEVNGGKLVGKAVGTFVIRRREVEPN